MKQAQLGRGLGVPMVVVDRPHFKTDANIAFVYADNYKGAAAVADHFIRKDHKRFACFTGPVDEVPNARMRMDGFLDELKRRGVTENACSIPAPPLASLPAMVMALCSIFITYLLPEALPDVYKRQVQEVQARPVRRRFWRKL